MRPEQASLAIRVCISSLVLFILIGRSECADLRVSPKGFVQRKQLSEITTVAMWSPLTQTQGVSDVKLDSKARFAALDDKRQLFFVATNHDISVMDLKLSKSQDIAPTQAGDGFELEWLAGLAYDPKEDRILVASFVGKGWLAEYTLERKAWNKLCELNNMDFHGLAYDQDSKQAISLVENDHGTFDLVRLSLDGSVSLRASVGQIVPPGQRQYAPGSGGVQLYADDRLWVVVAPGTSIEPKRQHEIKQYDLKTLKPRQGQ